VGITGFKLKTVLPLGGPNPEHLGAIEVVSLLIGVYITDLSIAVQFLSNQENG